MISKPAPGRQFFDVPATYQIQIQGRLQASLSEVLEGMVIHVSELTGGMPVTTLNGELPDQAALVGVLNQLYLLQVTVLSVTRVEDAHRRS